MLQGDFAVISSTVGIIILNIAVIVLGRSVNHWKREYEVKRVDCNSKTGAMFDMAAELRKLKQADVKEPEAKDDEPEKLLPYGATVDGLTQLGNAWLCTRDIYAVAGRRDGCTEVVFLVDGKLNSLLVRSESGECLQACLSEKATAEAAEKSRKQAEWNALRNQSDAEFRAAAGLVCQDGKFYTTKEVKDLMDKAEAESNAKLASATETL